ncbi:hypothetical protein [Halobacteriovorax sp. JY17]|uniref:hypothetical protein n=1 Tax=Halobacteriovorax sp. JY17 TaxID=2014617 RepID=UPI000C5E4D0C|nr:hypothetical protein [Halobacteriovorax sp. JY17]PIK15393.1 MAG: hypothetical protein CES88_01365 [Halobacteriovorax sp. JY17]
MIKLKKAIALLLILLLNSSCSIFNAGTAHLKYSDIDAGLEGNKYELKEKLGSISASIRQLEHPKGYRSWDYIVKLSPSIHLDRFEFQAGVAATSPTTTTNVYDLKYRRLSGLGNLKIEFFTPGGQLVFTAGFGGAIYRLDDGHGLKTTKTREVRKFDIAYSVFLTDRIFLMMGPRYYKTAFEQYTFTFRVGYFWGDVPRGLK